MSTLYGGIEAGGTKFVCAVGTDPDNILEEVRFPTEEPEPTLQKAVDFFKECESKYQKLSSIGIAAFGPVDLNKASKTWGYVTTTPKTKWINAEFAPLFQREFGIPVGFDTDVNGAAMGEQRWGAAQGCDSVVYITVGTGFGGGVLADGGPVHGLMHPEVGHMLLRRHPEDPTEFKGVCPFHGDCLEGMAAGPAIGKRWGKPAYELPEDHVAWDIEAYYLAQGLMNIILTASPEKIILGGGVMDQKQLFPKIRSELLRLMNGYIKEPRLLDNIDTYIVPTGLGNKSGISGAFVLAERAIKDR